MQYALFSHHETLLPLMWMAPLLSYLKTMGFECFNTSFATYISDRVHYTCIFYSRHSDSVLIMATILCILAFKDPVPTENAANHRVFSTKITLFIDHLHQDNLIHLSVCVFLSSNVYFSYGLDMLLLSLKHLWDVSRYESYQWWLCGASRNWWITITWLHWFNYLL